MKLTKQEITDIRVAALIEASVIADTPEGVVAAAEKCTAFLIGGRP